MVPYTPSFGDPWVNFPFKFNPFLLALSNLPSHFIPALSPPPHLLSLYFFRALPARNRPSVAMTGTGRWTMALIAVMAAAALLVGGAQAQSTPPQSSGCTNSLASLSPCLGFVTGNGSFSRPTQGCCSGLATVVKTSAVCLCQLISSSGNPLGIPINRTTALSLPGACNITTPLLSQCKAAGAPADAPASSPGSSPAGPTAAPPDSRGFPSVNPPTASPAPSTNIPPTNSDTENIPAESPRGSGGVAAVFTPSMMTTSALVGMMSAIVSIGW